MRRVSPSLLHQLKTPAVGEILSRVISWQDAVTTVVGRAWGEYDDEYQDVERMLAERYRTTQLVFPHEFGVESVTSRLLYLIARSMRPATVVETGVANGHTTVVLLEALRRNGSGELHSTDVEPSVGCLLGPLERRTWHYHQLPRTNPRRHLTALLGALAPIDFFFHDSAHGYAWQNLEYELAARYLSANGVIASDDVDASYAFLDFCSRHTRKPLLVLDSRKVTGIAPSM